MANADSMEKPSILSFFLADSERAYWIALRVTKNRVLAEEAVQEAFASLIAKPPKFLGENQAHKCFCVAVRRSAYALLRGEKRRKKRDESYFETKERFANGPDELSKETELALAARKALDSLPLDEREAISLCFEQGFTREDAADILAVSKQTVIHRVNRGLAKLRKILAQQGYSIATPLAVGTALSSLSLPAVPATLTTAMQNLAANPALAAAKAAKLSAKALYGGSTKKTILMAFWLIPTAVFFVVVAMAGSLWRQAGEANKNAISPNGNGEKSSESPAKELSFDWNFNDGKIPSEFEVIEGQCRVLPKGGINGSGCLSIESKIVVIVLGLSVDRLPLLVSCQQQIIPTPTVASHFVQVYWEKWTPPWVVIRNCGETIVSEPSDWITVKNYITATTLDSWASDRVTSERRTALNVATPVKNSRLKIVFRGRQLVDNITIKAVVPEKVPDVQSYLSAIAKLEPAKRFGSVILSDLKGADSAKPVTAIFYKTHDSEVSEADAKVSETNK